jgi:hypothetical protein
MTHRLCELDYAPMQAGTGLPVMVTLTYPGDWLAVAPDGQAAKKHLRAFLERWHRRWGERLTGVWKLEFQRRGAPHFHVLTTLPAASNDFRPWLSAAWAAVVGHPDPEERRRHQLAGTGVDFATGLRSRDPRRIAVYFTKHGTYAAKEYQHVVPEAWQERGKGPGRFWGYWGLAPCRGEVEVTPQLATAAARVMRRWAHAQGTTRQATVRRADRATGAVSYRRVRRRVTRLPRGRGWISVNDGPAFAWALSRCLPPP